MAEPDAPWHLIVRRMVSANQPPMVMECGWALATLTWAVQGKSVGQSGSSGCEAAWTHAWRVNPL